MESLFIYIFKASIGLFLFYLIYLLFLRNETFFKTNRFYLLTGLIISLLLPVFTYTYIIEVPITGQLDTGVSTNLAKNNSLEVVNGVSSFWIILSYIYFTGAGVLGLRLLWETASVFKMVNTGESHKHSGAIVVKSKKAKVPFSFFNYVIIDTEKYSEEEVLNILTHEKVHIRESHWIDLLIIELLTVVFWINPLIWLYEKTIKQNHEYLADQGVIRQGYNPGRYQAFLINQLIGINVVGFTNNLNFSLNKNRMKMMKKEKTPTIKKMKLLLVFPVVSMLIFAFAKPEYHVQASSEVAALDKVIVEGKVYNEVDKKPIGGANVIIKGKTIGTITDTKGDFRIEVDNGDVLAISCIGYEVTDVSVNEKTTGKLSIGMKPKVYEIEVSEDALPSPPPAPDPAPAPPPPVPSQEAGEDTFVIVEKMPEYTHGGMNGFMKDINEHVSGFIEKTGFRGKLFVQFVVDTDGLMKEINILRTVTSNSITNDTTSNTNAKEFETGIEEVFGKLDKWVPGEQRGKKVKVRMVFPIVFE